jgi:hypothetical protein
MDFTLLAQTDSPSLLHTIFADPGRIAILIPFVALTIPIVAIVMSGLKQIVWMVIRHRERIALIEAGCPPDQLPPSEGPSRCCQVPTATTPPA